MIQDENLDTKRRELKIKLARLAIEKLLQLAREKNAAKALSNLEETNQIQKETE